MYQDDRELENPSADLKLAREIAEITGGELVSLNGWEPTSRRSISSAFTEYLSPSEYKVWDNWPFLLIFATLLTVEWWLRKRPWVGLSLIETYCQSSGDRIVSAAFR